MWHERFQKILQQEHQKLLQKNPAYSLRAFAKRLGMSPGALSDVIRGKRQVSPAKLAHILSKLHIDQNIVDQILVEASSGRNVGRVLLPTHIANLVSRWIYFAILSVYECSRPPNSVEEMAARLGIDLSEAQQAVDMLLEAGLLKMSAEGQPRPTGISWRSEDGTIPKSFLLASHQDGLKLAEKALQKIPASERDFTSITVSAKKENLEKARKEIRKFNDRMAKLLSVEKTDSVFRLNISLFPVDRWDEFLADQQAPNKSNEPIPQANSKHEQITVSQLDQKMIHEQAENLAALSDPKMQERK